MNRLLLGLLPMAVLLFGCSSEPITRMPFQSPQEEEVEFSFSDEYISVPVEGGNYVVSVAFDELPLFQIIKDLRFRVITIDGDTVHQLHKPLIASKNDFHETKTKHYTMSDTCYIKDGIRLGFMDLIDTDSPKIFISLDRNDLSSERVLEFRLSTILRGESALYFYDNYLEDIMRIREKVNPNAGGCPIQLVWTSQPVRITQAAE